MNKIPITGSLQAIYSEQVLLASTFLSTSVARKKLLVTGSLQVFVTRAVDKNSCVKANYWVHYYKCYVQLFSACVASICNACTR